MPLDARIRRLLKLRDLDTLLAVAECGSMAKAAVQLAVSQPAVSKAIADMEHTLGVNLFDRLAQGVEPTPYGRALIKWAGAVFDDVRQGVEEIGFLVDPAPVSCAFARLSRCWKDSCRPCSPISIPAIHASASK